MASKCEHCKNAIWDTAEGYGGSYVFVEGCKLDEIDEEACELFEEDLSDEL